MGLGIFWNDFDGSDIVRPVVCIIVVGFIDYTIIYGAFTSDDFHYGSAGSISGGKEV